MIKLIQIIKYENSNTLEALWVKVKQITSTDEKGNEYIKDEETPVKCHAYDASQMDMLRADAAELGTPLTKYEPLIAEIESNIIPPFL